MVRLVAVMVVLLFLLGTFTAAHGKSEEGRTKINEAKRRWETTSEAELLKPGGFNCVGCVLAVNILFQYAETHEKNITEALEEVCVS